MKSAELHQQISVVSWCIFLTRLCIHIVYDTKVFQNREYINCAVFDIQITEYFLWWRPLESQARAWWRPMDSLLKTILHDEDHLIRIWRYTADNSLYRHMRIDFMTTHIYYLIFQPHMLWKAKWYNCMFTKSTLYLQKNRKLLMMWWLIMLGFAIATNQMAQ